MKGKKVLIQKSEPGQYFLNLILCLLLISYVTKVVLGRVNEHDENAFVASLLPLVSFHVVLFLFLLCAAPFFFPAGVESFKVTPKFSVKHTFGVLISLAGILAPPVFYTHVYSKVFYEDSPLDDLVAKPFVEAIILNLVAAFIVVATLFLAVNILKLSLLALDGEAEEQYAEEDASLRGARTLLESARNLDNNLKTLSSQKFNSAKELSAITVDNIAHIFKHIEDNVNNENNKDKAIPALTELEVLYTETRDLVNKIILLPRREQVSHVRKVESAMKMASVLSNNILDEIDNREESEVEFNFTTMKQSYGF